MKICLNLSGQVRLASGETLIDKIEHIKSAMHFDKIFMHLWLDDFLKYQDQLSNIENKTVVVVEPPILDEKFYIPNISKIITPYSNREYNYICEFYGMQCVFQRSCLEDNDIHIRARYDSFYFKKLNINKYFELLNTETPTVIIPMGGDWHLGVGNAFAIYNKSGAWIAQNILTNVYKMCKENIPFHPESLLRAHLINYNNFDLYRISYPMILNGKYLYHEDFPIGDQIVRDKMKFISEYLI